jgi:hypothetical protein
MANWYVDSTATGGTNSGTSWANAWLSLESATAANGVAAGDNIYVSKNHAENKTTGTITVNVPGTLAAPNNVICADPAATPPTAVAATAVVKATGNNAVDIRGHAYFYGTRFHSADTASSGLGITQAVNNAESQSYENCEFYDGSTHANGKIVVGNTGNAQGGMVLWNNCRVKFFATGQWIANAYGWRWSGGSIVSGSSAVTTIFRPQVPSGRFGGFLIEGVDLSNAASNATLLDLTDVQAMGDTKYAIRNCKLPAGWSGSLMTNAPSGQEAWRVEMHNCDSGDTNYRLWIEDWLGNIKNETTLIRTGGASDGITGLSWKIASNSKALYPMLPLRSPEIPRWNETIGSAVTVTVDVLHDSLTNLKDSEIWLEVQYLGTSGFPLGSFVSDAKADVLATAADQTASGASWTTTGMTNPNKQKLSVTFTPQEKGHIYAVVHLAKASYTVYVDPKLQVS